MAEMTSVLRPDEMVKNEELRQAVMNTLLDEDGSRTVSTPPQPKDLFVGYKLFKGFHEIHTALECLKNIEIYIRRFPFKNTRVTKLDYLKYNIENYLNEIYVLKERMISYSKTVVRAYQKSENSQNVESLLKEASLAVSESLKSIVETRGSHVHSSRYTDKDIDRLSSIDLMCKSNDPSFREVFEELHDTVYYEIRKKWVSTIKKGNSDIEVVVDRYCLKFLNAISDNGEIIYPTNVNWA